MARPPAAALSYRAMSAPHHTAIVERIEPMSEWVSQVTLRIEGERPFRFEPGQYVTIHLAAGGHRRSRHFSIASLPGDDNRIELCLADWTSDGDAEDGAMPRAGERLELSGPAGSFRLREPVDRDVLFIATGTGVSPLRPMIHRALAAGGAHRVTFLFGARTEDDILYRAEFEALAAREPRFRFLPTLSRPQPGWPGLSGYVQFHLDRVLAGRKDLDAYVCGLKPMLEAMRPLLTQRGFAREHVHCEKY